MKIQNLLQKNLIFFNKEFKSKNDALKFFANQLAQKKYADSSKKVYDLFLERENQATTGVGDGIAIPHLRNNVMKQSVVLFAKVKNLNWNALDNKPIKYIFAIALSKKEGENSHLKIIASLSKFLINPQFILELKKIDQSNNLINLFNRYEALENKKILANKQTSNVNKNQIYDVVAITACPTGIAHTFMAAQRLEVAAKKMKIKIKVETQGTEGIKNQLLLNEIKNAKGVILALDRAIATDRFANKNNIIEISTQKAIAKPEQMIQLVLDNKGKKLANIMTDEVQSTSFDNNNGLSFNGFFKKGYRSILTGVSYMLPFVVFGGIMIALAFLIDIIANWSNVINLEQIGYSKLGSATNGAIWFNNIGKIAFDLIVPMLAAYITFAMVGKIGLLPGFVVGFMAVGKSNSLLKLINLENIKIGSVNIIDVNSGFFGGIFGAFLVAAVIIVLMKYILNNMPKVLAGIKTILIVPFIGTLIVVVLFWFVNIPLQFLNLGFTYILEQIQLKPYISWLLGLILGGMMAFDLGGPVNKAAYVFGTTALTTSLTSGQGSLAMAAVMISGMIPPLGIALSTLVSKKHWSKEDRTAAGSNWIFGLNFISEGAIPFTAKNPKILVPVNVIAGALTGLISVLFGLSVQAPHGGIFVFLLFQSGLVSGTGAKLGLGIVLFLLTLVLGTIIHALLLHLFFVFNNKKDKKKFQINVKNKLVGLKKAIKLSK